MTAQTITIGKKDYSVVSRESTYAKYPNIAKLGWESIVAATLGKEVFCIYEHSNGNKKVIRAFV